MDALFQRAFILIFFRLESHAGCQEGATASGHTAALGIGWVREEINLTICQLSGHFFSYTLSES
jgi:hypothetical protein